MRSEGANLLARRATRRRQFRWPWGTDMYTESQVWSKSKYDENVGGYVQTNRVTVQASGGSEHQC